MHCLVIPVSHSMYLGKRRTALWRPLLCIRHQYGSLKQLLLVSAPSTGPPSHCTHYKWKDNEHISGRYCFLNPFSFPAMKMRNIAGLHLTSLHSSNRNQQGWRFARFQIAGQRQARCHNRACSKWSCGHQWPARCIWWDSHQKKKKINCLSILRTWGWCKRKIWNQTLFTTTWKQSK